MQITALYAGLLGPLLIVLSLRVIMLRRSLGVGLGDGGASDLQRRIRSQGNFAEYAPMALILMAIAESAGAPALIVHFGGASLVLGRVIHASALGLLSARPAARVAGMALTFTSIGVLSATALWLAVS